MALDAVIFDWGGTLTAHTVSITDVVDRWRQAAACLAPDHAETLTGLLFEADQALWDEARVHRRSFKLDDVLDRALDRLLAVGVPDAEMSGDRLEAERAYLDGWAEMIVHDPLAADVLAALRASGLAVGLLSNTFWPAAFHDSLLARDGLAGLFTGRCYSCDLDRLKPHPDAFAAAMSAVGAADPGRVLFVGDRADDDIAGAQAAGLRTAWRPNPTDPFAPPPPEQEPDLVISKLSDLLGLVDRWG